MSDQIFNTKDLICKILMLKGEKGDHGTNVDTAAHNGRRGKCPTAK